MSDIQPNLQQLVEELQSIRATWKLFGLTLGVPNEELEAINADEKKVADKLYAVCYKWLQIKPRGIWEDVVKALKKIKRLDVAERLEEKYINHNTSSGKCTSLKSHRGTNSPLRERSMQVESPLPENKPDINLPVTDERTKEIFIPKTLTTAVNRLESQFYSLFIEMKYSLRQEVTNNKLNIEVLQEFLCGRLAIPYQPIDITEGWDQIDTIFKPFIHYLNFLDTSLLHSIDSAYLNSKLEANILRYDENIEEFENSTSIVELTEMIQLSQSRSEEKSSTTVPVILRLGRQWNEHNVKNINYLIKYLFGYDNSLLRLISIHHSVLTIKYTVPRSLLLSLLIMASRKVRGMIWAGVLSIQVDTILMTVSTNENGIDPSDALLGVAYRYYDDPITNDIHLLVNIGGDVNTSGFNKSTPLMMAALVNNVAAAYALLQSKANPDIQDNNGVTALCIGSEKGHHQCVDLLLQAKANPDIQINDGATALYIGSQNGHHQCVDLLLQAKANPDIEANNGTTALYIGSQNGHYQCVDLLLQAKANPDIQANNGVTALHICSQNGHHQCVDLLLQSKANPDIQANNSATALLVGSQNGHHQCVDLLLQAKANPNIQDNSGATALYIGSQNGHHQCVDLLLQAKANPDIQDIDGATALCIGSQNGHHQCIDLLLQAKANPDIQDNNGATALYIGSQNGRHQCVDLLLQAKANPDIQANNGATALYIGSHNGHHQCVDLLLQAKANPDIQDNNGATALYIGSQNGHHQCVDLLLQAKANPDIHYKYGATPLHCAVFCNHRQIVSMLLEHNANPNYTILGVGSPLAVACDYGNLSIVSLLLRYGALVDMPGVPSPLIAAIDKGNYDIAKSLINAGANVNVQVEKSGATSLMIASARGNLPMVQLLLQSGADVMVQSKRGYTAYDAAKGCQHQKILTLLTIKLFEQAQKYLARSEECQEPEIVTSPQDDEILLESQSSDATPQFNSSENVSQPHQVNNETQIEENNQSSIETIRNHFNSMLDSLQASYKSWTKKIELIFENQHGFQQYAY